MRTLIRLLALATLLSLAAPAAADDSESIGKGKWTLRGGATLDLNKTINLGGTSDGSRVGGGVDAGVGYFVVKGLSLDLDFDARFLLAPEFDLTALGLTPGLRYFPLPQVYVRAGVPIVFLPSSNLGVLAGLGFRQKMAPKVWFVLAVDYTYWLTERFRTVAPQGQIDVHAGVQTHF